ncbi:hypothetical protein QP519_03075 [Weeksella virosa]|uniref:hypothetical protein n=1 Tax=Weeksella virosa TaxID=1014 RepID=UPI002556FA08|nr:hypothetical protein [Weeksella virosa]MDK7374519.1 hypothetical protein [Weeksella virosa]
MRYIYLLIILITVSCTEKYDAEVELEIVKKMLHSAKHTNYGEFPRKINLYNDLTYADDDSKVIEAGTSINFKQLIYIDLLSEIIDKTKNPVVTNEAKRLLDSLTNARIEFLNKRHIDY